MIETAPAQGCGLALRHALFRLQIVWHVLQEDWRLLLVTPTRFLATLKL
jgi:hypothetical protein